MDNKNILVVDDEVEITEAIEIYLRNSGYKVFKAFDGLKALDILEENHIDLIIMDIMMPKLDGMRATIKIRESKNIPIIILSAKSEDTDKILGLNMGADDYLCKPFNPLELLARVNSLLRRCNMISNESQKTNSEKIVVGGLELNKETKEFFVDGKLTRLTPIEFKMMSLLMDNPGHVFSLDDIYEKVWNEPAFNVDTVTVHIRRIREKIEINPKEPRYLKVVWGIGYKIEKI